MANEQTLKAGTYVLTNSSITIVATMNIRAVSINMITENGVATVLGKVKIEGLSLEPTAQSLQQNFPINIPAMGSGYIDGLTITADASTTVYLVCFQ